MNEMPKREWKTEGLIGIAAPGEVVILDCSGWESDIPDDQWCVGQLVGVTAPLEVVSGDFVHAEDAAPVEPAGGLRPSGEGGVIPAPAEKPAG